MALNKRICPVLGATVSCDVDGALETCTWTWIDASYANESKATGVDIGKMVLWNISKELKINMVSHSETEKHSHERQCCEWLKPH